MSDEALIGVGSAGLTASFALWAKTLVGQEIKPNAWLRIKPIVVI